MRTLLLLSVLLLSFSSCRFFGGKRIYGEGGWTAEQRRLSPFDGIDVSGALEVQVVQGAQQEVRIEADENLLPYIRTEVRNGMLHIGTKSGVNLRPTKTMKLVVTAPEFRDISASGAVHISSLGEIASRNDLSLEASGASSIDLSVQATELHGDISGASHLSLKGKAQKFSLEASGASHADCLDLLSDESTLDVSGACEAKVYANRQLNVEASGASHVAYRGNATIDQRSSGASSVKKVD